MMPCMCSNNCTPRLLGLQIAQSNATTTPKTQGIFSAQKGKEMSKTQGNSTHKRQGKNARKKLKKTKRQGKEGQGLCQEEQGPEDQLDRQSIHHAQHHGKERMTPDQTSDPKKVTCRSRTSQ